MNNEKARAVANAIAALRPPTSAEYVVELDGIELGIAEVECHYAPPSGRCRELCETPEEFYGETELSYSIVSIWSDDGRYNIIGSNLTLPPELSESDVDALVLEQENMI